MVTIPPLRSRLLRAPLAALLLAGCSATAEPAPPEKRAAAPAAPDTASRKPVPAACQRPGLPQTGLRRAPMKLHTSRTVRSLDVELCETSRQQQVGMMCRQSIDDDHGMLFIFNHERPRSFWMKNTLIPLDMVFIDSAGTVVSIIKNAEPQTLSSRRSSGPAQYVLELRGGFADMYGLAPGDKVDLPPSPKRTP